jgi:hypothetical protein
VDSGGAFGVVLVRISHFITAHSDRYCIGQGKRLLALFIGATRLAAWRRGREYVATLRAPTQQSETRTEPHVVVPSSCRDAPHLSESPSWLVACEREKVDDLFADDIVAAEVIQTAELTRRRERRRMQAA